MNKFEKVSYEQFKKDYFKCFPPCNTDMFGNTTEYNWNEEDEEWLRKVYDNIKLPSRAETGSAGYDFVAPITFRLPPKTSITIPTGIRVQLDNDKFLGLVPRSGLGFKFKLQLSNTFGVIDASYYFADNEGHIMAKLCNDNYEDKEVTIEEGKAFMQGIILPYFTTDNDNAPNIRRIGGFGSSNR